MTSSDYDQAWFLWFLATWIGVSGRDCYIRGLTIHMRWHRWYLYVWLTVPSAMDRLWTLTS
jgi:hypothetical protein